MTKDQSALLRKIRGKQVQRFFGGARAATKFARRLAKQKGSVRK